MRSSAVEHCLDTAGVTGSIPVAPTIFQHIFFLCHNRVTMKGNTMASIRKRGTKWQVQVRHKGHKLISKTFIRKAEADKWAREVEISYDQDKLTYHEKKYPLFVDIIDRYIQQVSVMKRGQVREVYFLNQIRLMDLAQLPLNKILPYHIARLRDSRLQKNKSSTVLRELTILNHIFNVCRKDWSYKIMNPVKEIYKPKNTLPRKRRLTHAEYNFLVNNNIASKKLKSVIELAIETGMRRGEILNIKEDHLRTNILLIPSSKNGSSRDIPLSSKALIILSSIQLPIQMTANALKLAWSRLKKKGNIKDLHFHDLRHEAISRFFEKGLSIPEVALISGHRDVRMLFRYTHLKAEDILKKL